MGDGDDPDKRSRIALFHPYPHRMGGSQVVTLLLAKHLPTIGYEPVLVCPEAGALTTAAADQGTAVAVHSPPPSWRVYGLGTRGLRRWVSARHAIDLVRYWISLRKWLIASRIAVLHCNDIRAVVMAAPAGRLATIPVVWHVHGGPSSRMNQWIDPVLAMIAKNTVFVSEGMIEYWTTPHGLLGTRRIIHNGQDPAKQAKPLARDQSRPLIVAVGALQRRKGHDVLLRSIPTVLTHIPNLECWIVGKDWTDGAWEETLKKMTTDLGLQNVVSFLGQSDDVAALMATADCVVIPSRSESFGMVALEAMAQARPVVAASTGGLRDIVLEGETGLLVPVGDADAFADAIVRVLADPLFSRRLGAAGGRRVSEFSGEKMARNFGSLYSSILRAK